MNTVEPEGERYYDFGLFRVDTARRLLLREGLSVSVTPKVFETLLTLVRNRGRVLGKEELLKTVWRDSFVEEANLAQTISTLRKVLGESSGSHRYIVTVPGSGYRFVAAVKESAATDGQEPAAERSQRSVAALPFASLDSSESDALGLGMADALITKLSNIRDIRVLPTSAILKYATMVRDPVSVARELGVTHVLDGRIQRSGDRIRVTVQLVSASDGTPIWADKFDDRFADIFEVEDSISERVAKALTAHLTRGERKQLTRHPAKSPSAYQAYWIGRFHWNKRTVESLRTAINYFRQAIEEDPGYALAYAGLADAYNVLVLWGIGPPKEYLRRAKAAALRALAIDDDLAEAHTALGLARMKLDFDWAGADYEFQRASRLDPGYAPAHQWRANLLLALSRPGEAISEDLLAQQLEPLSLIISSHLVFVYFMAHEYGQATAQAEKTLEMDPNYFASHFYCGLALAAAGQARKAIDALQKAESLFGGGTLMKAAIAWAYGIAGDHNVALGILSQLTQGSDYVSADWVAAAYITVGCKDHAKQWLEEAVEERAAWAGYLSLDPRFETLRSEGWFSERLQRLGLPAKT